MRRAHYVGWPPHTLGASQVAAVLVPSCVRSGVAREWSNGRFVVWSMSASMCSHRMILSSLSGPFSPPHVYGYQDAERLYLDECDEMCTHICA